MTVGLRPITNRLRVATSRTFGWSVREGDHAKIRSERKAALDSINHLTDLMRADLGVEVEPVPVQR